MFTVDVVDGEIVIKNESNQIVFNTEVKPEDAMNLKPAGSIEMPMSFQIYKIIEGTKFWVHFPNNGEWTRAEIEVSALMHLAIV